MFSPEQQSRLFLNLWAFEVAPGSALGSLEWEYALALAGGGRKPVPSEARMQ
jgi:hypothetical protein